MTAKAKKYYITSYIQSGYDTYEEAETAAKKQAANRRGSDFYYICGGSGGGDVGIYELVALAVEPTPEVEVTKVK
jgi:hypothetical protein